jgi:hypothetical protein
MRKYFYAIGLFLSGVTVSVELTWLRYGIPINFNGGWGKVGVAVFFALWFGYMLTKRTEN